MSKAKKREYSGKSLLGTVGALALILVMFFGWFVGLDKGDRASGFSNAGQDWGVFGDFFGGVLNPAVALAALVMLVRTITLQRQALDLSTKTSARTLSRLDDQHFTDQYFRILDLFSEVRLNFVYRKEEGTGAFSEMLNQLSGAIGQRVPEAQGEILTADEVAEGLAAGVGAIDVGSILFNYLSFIELVWQTLRDNGRENDAIYLGSFVSLLSINEQEVLFLFACTDWASARQREAIKGLKMIRNVEFRGLAAIRVQIFEVFTQKNA